MKTTLHNNADKARLYIERYYAGDSSRDEELWLRRYFMNANADDLPDDLQDDAELFRMVADEAESLELNVPEDLEDKIKAAINNVAESREKGLGKFKIMRIVP